MLSESHIDRMWGLCPKSYKSPVEYHGVVYGLKGYTKFLSHKKDTKLIAPKCLTKIEFKYFI